MSKAQCPSQGTLVFHRTVGVSLDPVNVEVRVRVEVVDLIGEVLDFKGGRIVGRRHLGQGGRIENLVEGSDPTVLIHLSL